jgi:hypothetical protein
VESILAERALTLAVKALNELTNPQTALNAPMQLTRVPRPAMPTQPAMAGRPEPPTQQVKPAGEAEASAPAKAAASAGALAAGLRGTVAERVRQDPRLQALLLNLAEKAVGPAWEPMRALLEEIGSPATAKYLNSRRG